MGNTLIVCRKNVVRSPMVELMTKIILYNSGYDLNSCSISSAGVSVTGEHNRMSRRVVTALFDIGYVAKDYDPYQHTPEPITPNLLSGIDLVLTAEYSQSRAVLRMAPKLEGRVHTMTHYAGLRGSVSDPEDAIVNFYDNYKRFRPLFWRKLTLYRGTGGKVHKNDERAIRRLYKRKAKEIERIVQRIIPRLDEEGLVQKLA